MSVRLRSVKRVNEDGEDADGGGDVDDDGDGGEDMNDDSDEDHDDMVKRIFAVAYVLWLVAGSRRAIFFLS